MKSAIKTNLILAGILAVLATFALWYEYKYRPVAEKKESDQTKVVAELLNKEIDSVRVVSAKEKTNVLFTCKDKCKIENPGGSRWEIQEPIKFRADDGTLTGALSALVSAVPAESIDVTGADDPALKGFGLDLQMRTSNYVETLSKGEKQPYVFFFGEKSPVGENIYTYVTGPDKKGNKVYLLPTAVTDALAKKLSYWRYKRLFDVASSEIKEVAFKGASGDFKLVRTGTEWFIEPGHMLADNESVETNLAGIISSNAVDFISDKSGLSSKYSVALAVDKKDPIRIQAWENTHKPPEQFLSVAGGDYIAKVDLGTFQKFQRRPDDFRLKQLFRASEKYLMKIAKVTFASKGSPKTHEIVDNGSGWTSASIAGFNAARFDDVLLRLGSLRVTTFLGKKKPPSGAKKVSAFELFNAEKKLLRSVHLFKEPGSKGSSQWYAKVGDGELVQVEGIAAAGIPDSEEKLIRMEQPSPVAPVTSPIEPAGGDGHAHDHEHEH